jgi:hypothetical protein
MPNLLAPVIDVYDWAGKAETGGGADRGGGECGEAVV